MTRFAVPCAGLVASLLAAECSPCLGTEAERDEHTITPLAARYCSACHLPPRPGAIIREHWPEIFGFMADWIQERQLPYDAGEYRELLDYYVANSPEQFPPPDDDLPESPLAFRRAALGRPASAARPKITNLNFTDLDGSGREDVLICDDVAGQVSWLEIADGKWNETVLARIDSPVKTHVFDFDGDGHQDIVVAALGFLSPTDDLIGTAWLLRNRGDQSFESINLLQNTERVADIKPGDFNGDGKIDFAVAQFGWRETGVVSLLEQITPTTFVRREVISVHGAMQLEVIDFDRDGWLDFVVLFAQEHESVVLFRNEGNGTFTNRILVRALHPAFGSSGFELVDLDQDGDIDILHTNGDMMDEITLPKPYHGLRWFENVGGEFVIHELARMTGCYRALARDMDGDGHLDIVASSLNFYWSDHDEPSLIWLKNDGKQNFTPYRIAYAPTNLATMDIGDLNGDGLPDIIVGGMHVPGPLGREGRVTGFFQKPPEAEAGVETE